MKAQELRNLNEHELNDKLDGLHKELYELTFQKHSGKVDKPHRFRQLKRDIARIKTILGEKNNEEPKDN